MAKAKSSNHQPTTFAERLLAKRKEAEGSSFEAQDADFAAKHPHCTELLTTVLRDEKKVLEPGSLTIYCRSGSWHACLSHKALKLKWFAEGGTFATCLEALEAAVRREEGQEAT